MWIKLLSEDFRKMAPKDRDLDIFFEPIETVETYYKQQTKLIECSNCSFFGKECWLRDRILFNCSKNNKRTIWISKFDLKIRRKRFLKEFNFRKIKELKRRRF